MNQAAVQLSVGRWQGRDSSGRRSASHSASDSTPRHSPQKTRRVSTPSPHSAEHCPAAASHRIDEFHQIPRRMPTKNEPEPPDTVDSKRNPRVVDFFLHSRAEKSTKFQRRCRVTSQYDPRNAIDSLLALISTVNHRQITVDGCLLPSSGRLMKRWDCLCLVPSSGHSMKQWDSPAPFYETRDHIALFRLLIG